MPRNAAERASAELTDAQRADHHARREEILKRKGLVKDSPKGGRPRNSDNLSAYSKQTAATLGVDERTVRRNLSRGKKITAEVLAEVSTSRSARAPHTFLTKPSETPSRHHPPSPPPSWR